MEKRSIRKGYFKKREIQKAHRKLRFYMIFAPMFLNQNAREFVL